MAAKLCLECGGSGKIAIPGVCIPYLGIWDVPTIIQCEECKGLGYIPIT